MPKLTSTLSQWPDGDFSATLKKELKSLGADALPLRQAATVGGPVDPDSIRVVVLDSGENDASIHANVGVFFDEILWGCSCGDDPVPQQNYCRLRVAIRKTDAEANISYLPD